MNRKDDQQCDEDGEDEREKVFTDNCQWMQK